MTSIISYIITVNHLHIFQVEGHTRFQDCLPALSTFETVYHWQFVILLQMSSFASNVNRQHLDTQSLWSLRMMSYQYTPSCCLLQCLLWWYLIYIFWMKIKRELHCDMRSDQLNTCSTTATAAVNAWCEREITTCQQREQLTRQAHQSSEFVRGWKLEKWRVCRSTWRGFCHHNTCNNIWRLLVWN